MYENRAAVPNPRPSQPSTYFFCSGEPPIVTLHAHLYTLPLQVPHVRQMFNWDCGLACVLMVIRTLGIENYDTTDLENFCSTTSIWTIDLAYLLHKFSVNFSFLTITLGANPHYCAEDFTELSW